MNLIELAARIFPLALLVACGNAPTTTGDPRGTIPGRSSTTERPLSALDFSSRPPSFKVEEPGPEWQAIGREASRPIVPFAQPASRAASPAATPSAQEVRTFPSATLNEADYLFAPGGRRIHSSCVYHVAQDARVEANGDIVHADGKVEPTSPCTYPEISPVASDRAGSGPVTDGVPAADSANNIENANAFPQNNPYGLNWYNGMEVGLFVPPAPPSGDVGQALSLWMAFQPNTGAHDVLQPLLLYGHTVACSDAAGRWEVVNAQYYNGNMFCSGSAFVNPGDAIYLEAYVNSCPDNSGTNCQWSVGFEAPHISHFVVAQLMKSDPNPLGNRAIIGDIEIHNAHSCNNLPGNSSTQFYVLAITMPGPSWNNYTDISRSSQYMGLLTWINPSLPSDVPANCGYNVQFTNSGGLLDY